MAPGDFDSADLQRFLINPEMDLAPDPSFGAAMLARMPLAFALDLDASAVDQQVQRPLGPAIWDVYSQRLLAAAKCAEVGHRPVEANQPQQAFNEACRLTERHAEQHLHRQAGLDGDIAVGPQAATPACRCGIPSHSGIEPDGQ